MQRRRITASRPLLPYILFGGGLLMILFWILYFSELVVSAEDANPLQSAFESAFPIADGVVCIVLIVAGVFMLKQRPLGTFSLVAAASMVLYLGLLDATFNAVQGFYGPLTLATAMKFVINGGCIIGGSLGLFSGWKRWRVR